MNNRRSSGFGAAVADQIEESLVEARGSAQLGVESRGHRIALPDGDWIFFLCGYDFDAGAETLDLGGTDENHFDRRSTEDPFTDGAVDLAAVGVAADGDINCAQAG